MKKAIIYTLLILAITTFTSCSGRIWDISPVNISFFVTDSQGEDLLNPLTYGNISKNNIKVIYDGKDYPIDIDMSPTRAYMATLSGLKTEIYNNRYCLTFGEFDGATNHDKSFIIDWGDGRQDKISFVHRHRMSLNKPKSNTKIYLNDKKVEKGFIIVK